MDEIKQMLDALAELESMRDVLRIDHDAQRKEILKVVQAELDALDDEYAPQLLYAADCSEELAAAIRSAVLAHGDSVKGARKLAVFVKGRVSWETKLLDGFAMAHPEILAARKEGEPQVQIRNR